MKPAVPHLCPLSILGFILFVMAGCATVKTPVAPVPDESGAYYDWTVTGQPERPYIHNYDQTFVMKIKLADKLPGEKSHVYLRCDQALGVIRRIDNLTCGVPKIVYLVGWQYNGHDSKYPAWGEVNPGIKHPQDATALDSLKWLMAEGCKYHTTISLHINMMDAYQDSPLWDEYLRDDVIAKDTNGVPIKAAVWPKGIKVDAGTQSYNISYAREWELGLAQERIDGLLAMLPIQKAGTIHIGAFHTIPPTRRAAKSISPYLGYSLQQEAAAQRKIYRYFRDHGVDVTSEKSSMYRIDPFIGLQPMAYGFTPVGTNVPPSLYCGTAMGSMEGMILKDARMPGLTEQFCTRFLPWCLAHTDSPLKGSQKMIETPQTVLIGGENILTGDDICMPALWMDHALIAYSKNGYSAEHWNLPPGWETVRNVKVSALTQEGPKEYDELPVKNGALTLSLQPDEGVLIEPADVQN